MELLTAPAPLLALPARRTRTARLVVATDFSPTSRRALLFGLRLAGPRSQARLVHVLRPTAPESAWTLERARGRSRSWLAREARAAAARGLRCSTRLLLGPIAESIVSEARRFRAGAIVCGTQGRRGLKRLLLGSVAERLLQTSNLPVVVVPHRPIRPAFRKVVVAIDFSRASGAALAFAVSACRRRGAALEVVHAADTTFVAMVDPNLGGALVTRLEHEKERAQKKLSAVLDALARSGIRATARLDEGSPAGKIVGLARRTGADLVVLGTRGLGGAGRFFLGSVSREVVRTAPCPVAVVPEPKGRSRRRSPSLTLF
ncbi:MAG TPA: universal stress protein [Planctomycetota bacterium]|jgi:nucleotide-binding universal stress UspA family protein|nr:universal stress protein [Planctomycetota bacterium]